MNKLDELKRLLENVPDSYQDFVDAGLSEAENNDEFADKVISYINANPSASTSEIIRFETETIFGIKPSI